MSDSCNAASLSGLLDAAHAAVDGLQAVDLTRGVDDDTVEALRSVERLRRRLDWSITA